MYLFYKKLLRLKLFTLIPALFFSGFQAQARLITYSAPQGITLNREFTVKVRDQEPSWRQADVYMAEVAQTIGNHFSPAQTCFTYFDCDTDIEVEITLKRRDKINAIRISPARYGIVPRISGNRITLTIKPGETISVEVDGNLFNNLQVFANPIDIDKAVRPKNSSSFTYFGPGIHFIGKRAVHSNETIYIAGGAVVLGSLVIDHAENVKILGSGILTQQESKVPKAFWDQENKQTTPGTRDDQIQVSFSKNISIDGICVLPHKYSVLIGNSDNVTIRNFKAFSSEGNADGIDIFCSSNINIDHIFMRNSDDCIAIYGHRWNYYGNTANINVSNAVLWADVAHPILIGTHGDSNQPDTLEKMKFTNLAVLNHHENQLDYQGCIALNAGDDNLLRDINFDNVDIERITKGQLVNLRIMFNRKYNTSPGKGIENIRFKNLRYSGEGTPLSIINGYDDTRTITNVLFVNLKIGDTLISDRMNGKPAYYKTGDMANIFWGEHVQGIRFVTNDDPANDKH